MKFGEKTSKVSYFSVTYTTEIGQSRYVPQVCYKLDDGIRAAVEKMAGNGLACIYDAEVRFISGVAIPLQKPDKIVKVVAPSMITIAAGDTTAHKEANLPAGRRGKRAARAFE